MEKRTKVLEGEAMPDDRVDCRRGAPRLFFFPSFFPGLWRALPRRRPRFRSRRDCRDAQ
jgi:hypothetical protein